MAEPPSDPVIGVIAASEAEATACAAAIERHGGLPCPLPLNERTEPEDAVRGINGLLLCDGDQALIKAALSAELPVLGVGSGMQALNVALGGRPGPDAIGHGLVEQEGEWVSSFHRIYISPGSKLAAVVGAGGFVRVNSRHPTGIREVQKAQSLKASAYSLEDGFIEALESPDRRWAMAVQFHPERRKEIPPHFDRLFETLVARATVHAAPDNSPENTL